MLNRLLLAAAPLGLVTFIVTQSLWPASCCGPRDCSPLPDGAVEPVAAGWHIVETGEVIPYSDARIKPSRDGRFHRCVYLSTGGTRCLLTPLMGA